MIQRFNNEELVLSRSDILDICLAALRTRQLDYSLISTKTK